MNFATNKPLKPDTGNPCKDPIKHSTREIRIVAKKEVNMICFKFFLIDDVSAFWPFCFSKISNNN
jgi:hypothetical protein